MSAATTGEVGERAGDVDDEYDCVSWLHKACAARAASAKAPQATAAAAALGAGPAGSDTNAKRAAAASTAPGAAATAVDHAANGNAKRARTRRRSSGLSELRPSARPARRTLCSTSRTSAADGALARRASPGARSASWTSIGYAACEGSRCAARPAKWPATASGEPSSAALTAATRGERPAHITVADASRVADQEDARRPRT